MFGRQKITYAGFFAFLVNAVFSYLAYAVYDPNQPRTSGLMLLLGYAITGVVVGVFNVERSKNVKFAPGAVTVAFGTFGPVFLAYFYRIFVIDMPAGFMLGGIGFIVSLVIYFFASELGEYFGFKE